MTRWQRLIAFVTTPEDATALALTRIMVSTTLAVHVLTMIVTGAGRLAWSPASEYGLSTSPVADLLGGYGVMLLAVGLVITGTLCAVGWRTRTMLVLCWLGFRALSEVSRTSRGAFDMLMIDTFFVLLLSGCGNTLSVDARRHGERPTWRFARLLLCVQVAVLYFGSGLSKMSLSWLPQGKGDALWFTIQQPIWSRFRTPAPDALYPVLTFLTKGAWLFEITAPIWLLAVVLEMAGSTSRLARGMARLHVKEIYILSGIGLHLGIELLLEVGPFSYASWSLYPCLILPTTWMRLRARARAL